MYYKVTAYIHYHRYMTVLLLEQLNISKCTVSTPVQRGIPFGMLNFIILPFLIKEGLLFYLSIYFSRLKKGNGTHSGCF